MAQNLAALADSVLAFQVRICRGAGLLSLSVKPRDEELFVQGSSKQGTWSFPLSGEVLHKTPCQIASAVTLGFLKKRKVVEE